MRNLVEEGGEDLSIFLLKESTINQMKNTRCFYIVEPNLDAGRYFKIGIAGEKTGNSYARLRSYEITYGTNSEPGECNGVWIWFCGVTKFSGDNSRDDGTENYVSSTQSQIHKVEVYLKAKYKREGLLSELRGKRSNFRGSERIRGIDNNGIAPQQVIQEIKTITSMGGVKNYFQDTPNKIRKTKSRKGKEIQTFNKPTLPNKDDHIEYEWDLKDGNAKWFHGYVKRVTKKFITVQYPSQLGYNAGTVQQETKHFKKGKTWRYFPRKQVTAPPPPPAAIPPAAPPPKKKKRTVVPRRQLRPTTYKQRLRKRK